MIKKLLAKYWYDLPYEIRGYWPAWRKHNSNESYLEHEAIFFDTDANEGDTVDVLHDYEGTVHSYEITSKYSASGSDHIYNPIQFNLEYRSSRKINTDKYDVKDIDDMYTPKLMKTG